MNLLAAAGPAVLLLFLSPCLPAQEVAAPDPRGESTRKMAKLLASTLDGFDPMDSQYFTVERLVVMREELTKALGTPGELKARMRLAHELVHANLLDEAFEQFDLAEKLLATEGEEKAADVADDLLRWRALGWLRRGEIENCLTRHGCSSCIFPLASDAVHMLKTGSETSIPLLLQLLEKDPGDLESLWLLNIAHMTLGTWPAGVPERFLVPPAAFASEYEPGRFVDVAKASGFEAQNIAGGVVTDDFDGDGRIDVMLSSMGPRDRMFVYKNNGDGTFTERMREAGLEGIVGGLNMTHADYDNDGDVDVLVLRGAWFGEVGCVPNSLLRNRGDGTFDDVTEAAGILSFHPTQTGTFADLDNDGWLDLVIGNETRPGDPVHPCELYRNNQDGTFTEMAAKVGADVKAFVKAVAAGDIDNDGRIDLFYSCRNAQNRLLRNEATRDAPGFRFRDVTRNAGVGQPRMSFPSWFFDYDNDGWLDLFVATNASFAGDHTEDAARLYLAQPTDSEFPCLYRNLRNGKFANVAHEAGVDRVFFSMGGNYGDLDNDGWPDFYLGTGSPSLRCLVPNRMFRNDGGKRFQDVTTSGGFGHLQKGHAIAFADFDNDGDQDVFADLGGAYSGDFFPCALFENPGHGNHWVTLRLRGVKANRCAIGARIQVRVATPAGERSIHVLAGTGGSFGSSSLQQEIGLGDATKILFAEVRWPGSAAPQKFTDVPLDRFVELVEGGEAARPIDVPRFKLGRIDPGAAAPAKD